MSLLPILILSLGPSIAKALLKYWLKDYSIASDIGSDLIDLLKQKTSDEIAQKRVARQFEVIGERVAESLAFLFEMEGTSIQENGRRAVALAIATTLDKARIDSKLLVERNLEPRRLVEHLQQSDPLATRDFSSAEKALYDRILVETSQYIIDISSQLPKFNERAFGEVLGRQTQLQDIAEEILREVQRIRADTKKEDERAAEFEIEYRRSVLRTLDELRLFGVDASTASRRHRLSVAYVTLSVRQASKADDELTAEIGVDIRDDRKKEKIAGEPDDHPKNIDTSIPEADEITTVDKTLERNQKLVILGEAGSGKTTLLQWIAVRSAQGDFEETLSQWNETTPFFIRLRQCAETGLPGPEDFPKFVAPAIAGSMPVGWVHENLKTGRVVVLIDGLDELGQAMRDKVADWLDDLVSSYPQARFIVSSRPYAVEEDWLCNRGFRHAELLPMELGDIDSFIEHWHEAVREQLQTSEEKQEIAPTCDRLKETVRGSLQIRKLATNPLLCAMLCALHRDRQQRLPSDRIELYEACFRMLVDRRDLERGVDLTDYPDLTYRQKRTLLQDFAYWLLKNGYAMVSVVDAEKRFDGKLPKLEGITKLLDGSNVLRLFIQRSGILREPIKDEVDFTHRTFQEFLGAQASLDDGDLGLLINKAHEQEWREVIVLAAGLARSSEREHLIKSLIARGDNEPHLRHQLHLLAVACLETSVELAPDVKKSVTDRLRRLVPPANITEAKALSSAGELALPFLTYEDQYARVAAACVRTLVLIGGENALRILERYARDSRVTVVNEITRGWDYFDRVEYAKRIFSKRHSLMLQVPSSLEGLEELKLQSLSIGNAAQLRTIEPISSLPELRRLSLRYLWRVSDLAPLSKLRNLVYLYVFFCAASDVGFVQDLEFLESLTLAELKNLSDLSALTAAHNLKRLAVWSTKIKELDMSRMSSLAELDLSYNSKLSDLSFITATTLRNLLLSDCPNLIDLHPLGKIVELNQLDLDNCSSIENIEPLAKLTKLEALHLSGCPKIKSLEPIYNLPNLQRVWLKGTPRRDDIPEEFTSKILD